MIKKYLSYLGLFSFLLPLLGSCKTGQVPPPAEAPQQALASSTSWVRKFEGPDYGAFFDLLVSKDGQIVTVGSTNHLHVAPYSGDALIMELSLTGDVLWEQTWGGEGYEQAWAVAEAQEGYYIFGETDSFGAGDRDFFLLKTSAEGAEEWHRTYGRSQREWPYGLLKLANGDLLMYGFSEPETGPGRNQYAVRVSPEGEIIWQYLTENKGEELVLDALETAQGDLVLATIIEEDGQLVKLDASGNWLWSQRYELAGWQYASQIAPTEDGGFLLAGFSMGSNPRQVDTWLARTSPGGELVWEKTFGSPDFDDYGTSLIQLRDGTYLIGAISNGMLLNRITVDGAQLWSRSLVGKQVYGVMDLEELDAGGFLAAGFLQLVNGRSYDAILLRTDPDGLVGE